MIRHCAWLWGWMVLGGVLQIPSEAATKENAMVSFGGVHLRSSPNGKQVAMSYQGSIAVLNRDSGKLRLLTEGPGWDIHPAWLAKGQRLLFCRSIDFRVGNLMMLDLPTGEETSLGVRVRGEMYVDQNDAGVFAHFSSRGYPDRFGRFDLERRTVSALSGLSEAHSRKIGDGFAWLAGKSAILYAIHRDQPGEQTGNRGPQADLWMYSIATRTTQRLGQVGSRVFRLAPGRNQNQAIMVSDWGGAHYDLWSVQLPPAEFGFERMTAGLADEDWPSVTNDGDLIYSDNAGNATRIVTQNLDSGQRTDMRLSEVDFGEPTRSIILEISTGDDNAANVGRLSIRRKGGRFYFPNGALYRITGGLGHFYGRGRVELELPYGEYALVAYKGTEFSEVRHTFSVDQDSEAIIPVRFSRWVHPTEEHWFSGENHIHANYGYGAWYSDVNTVADQVEGEGLNVANLVVANSDGDGVFDRPFFLGGPDRRSTDEAILIWNEEFRSTMWGHLTIVDLERLVEPIFTGFAETTNPLDVPTNAEVAQRARVQGASVSYTHPAGNRNDPYQGAYSAKGLPVDAALGVIDTLDVLGFGYDATLPLWYRLLNCGFRIPAAAGTDCFLNRIRSFPPGWGRCYVRLPGGLDYDEWIEGQRAGRSFVSTGPIVDFRVNNARSGGTIQWSDSGVATVRFDVQAQYPIDRIEIVWNGEILDKLQPAPDSDRRVLRYERKHRLEGSGWIAARVWGGAPADYVGRRQVAHANPIYVEIEGRPSDPGDHPKYFLDWIDRLDEALEQRNRYGVRRGNVKGQLEEAREVYRAMGR